MESDGDHLAEHSALDALSLAFERAGATLRLSRRIESALGELEAATTALEQAVAEVASTTPGWRGRRSDRVLERMHRGYTNLREALSDAAAAAAAARSLTSRALGRPSRRS